MPTNPFPLTGEPAINGQVSLRQAGFRLGVNPQYVKGMAETLGIHLEDVPPSFLMSGADFARIKQQYEKIQRERQQTAAASA